MSDDSLQRRVVCRLCFIFAIGLFAVAATAPADEAKLAHADKQGWIDVPETFLVSRLVAPVGAPAQTYQTIVDMPLAASPKVAHPVTMQTSRDGVIDYIGREYARHVLEISKARAEQNRTQLLRFKLRIIPARVDFKQLHCPFTAHPSELDKDGFYTPRPEYPRDAFMADAEGTCRVRAVFSAAGGHPIQVALEASSGNEYLDRATVLTAQTYWYGPKRPKPAVISASMSFYTIRAYG